MEKRQNFLKKEYCACRDRHTAADDGGMTAARRHQRPHRSTARLVSGYISSMTDAVANAGNLPTIDAVRHLRPFCLVMRPHWRLR